MTMNDWALIEEDLKLPTSNMQHLLCRTGILNVSHYSVLHSYLDKSFEDITTKLSLLFSAKYSGRHIHVTTHDTALVRFAVSVMN